MSKIMKIAILGGGNMGGSIAFGAVERGLVAPADMKISFPSDHISERFEKSGYGVEFTDDNVQTITGADVVIVAVKPWLAEQVFGEIGAALTPNQMVVSIVAGAKMATLASYMGRPNQPIFRVIPNTAITLGMSTTFISYQSATEQQKESIGSLFASLGELFFVQEDMMTAMTALSSCGIAYAFKYIDAAMQGGEQMGIERSEALRIVIQTVKGALAMLEANGTEPQTEIDKVTTPGGMTLKGLTEMDRQGFNEAVIEGIKASTR